MYQLVNWTPNARAAPPNVRAFLPLSNERFSALQYFSANWNVLDFVIVVGAWISLAFEAIGYDQMPGTGGTCDPNLQFGTPAAAYHPLTSAPCLRFWTT